MYWTIHMYFAAVPHSTFPLGQCDSLVGKEMTLTWPDGPGDDSGVSPSASAMIFLSKVKSYSNWVLGISSTPGPTITCQQHHFFVKMNDFHMF